MNIRQPLVCSLALLAIAGCGRSTPDATPAPPPAAANADAAGTHHPGGDIHWFDGDVTAAIATAKAEDKPLLLYWGAAWCPPCHLLKATVFADSRFAEKSRLFVPVYLDGDLPDAQRWGERFQVTGYPTMLVLDPDQNEIARISGGLDLHQYAGLLDQALQDGRPIQAVLDALVASDAAKRPADRSAACRRVAWNSWGLSDEVAAGSTTLIGQLRAAAAACRETDPALALRLLAFAGATATATAQPARQIDATFAAELAPLLNDDAAADQYDALRYLEPDFFRTLAASQPAQAQQLVARYVTLMTRAATDARFTRADQLGALYSALLAEQVTGAAEGSALATDARKRIDTEMASLPDDPYLRSGVVTGVLEVMDALGEHERAYRLAHDEIAKSKYGFYFMSTLADICESMGRNEEALQWYERAFVESRGAATRVQWGVSYAQAVLRLAPADTQRVRQSALQVIGELKSSQGLFRRSRTRMARFDTQLREWAGGSAERRAVLKDLGTAYSTACPVDCAPFLAG